MKKEKPTLCFAEASGNYADTAQSLCKKEECTIVGRSFASTAKNPTKHETEKYVENIQWKPQSRIICD